MERRGGGEYSGTLSNVIEGTIDNNCDSCVIGQLLKKPFSVRDTVDQLKIIKDGRCTPSFRDLAKETDDCRGMRYFQHKWYNIYPWLTGCEDKLTLHCWPCLLFPSSSCVWSMTSSEVRIRGKFETCSKSHEFTKTHLQALIEFRHRVNTMPSDVDVSHVGTAGYGVDGYRGSVKINRMLLKRLIDITCMVSLQGSSPTGRRRKRISQSRRKYTEILEYTKTIDKNFSHCFKISPYFKSPAVYNHLSESLCELMVGVIKSEIKSSPFYSVIINTITDRTHKTRRAVVFRYLAPSGYLQERLLYVSHCGPQDQDDLPFKELEWLEDFAQSSKVVSLSYDGPSNAISVEFEKKFKVLLTHCYSHRINLMSLQYVKNIESCRKFFRTIANLALFFSQSDKRNQALVEIIMLVERRNLNKMVRNESENTYVPTSWLFTSKLLVYFSDNVNELYELLEDIFRNQTGEWDEDTRHSAKQLHDSIDNLEFRFLLGIFSNIQPKLETLNEILQKQIFTDHKHCWENLSEFIKFVKVEMIDFSELWCSLLNKTVPGFKEKCIENHRNVTPYSQLYFKIYDAIAKQITDTVSSLFTLTFLSLLDGKKMERYNSTFPESQFMRLKERFGHLFNCDRLRTELSAVYSCAFFRQWSLPELYKYLIESKVNDDLNEVTNLAGLILVLPVAKYSLVTTSTSRINSHLILSKHHLNKRSILTIEKDLLKHLWKKPTFHSTLIAMYADRTAPNSPPLFSN